MENSFKIQVGAEIPDTDLVVEEIVAHTKTSSLYRVRSRSIKREFCAKIVSTEGNSARWRREVQALSALHHPNIVKLFRCVALPDHLAIVLEWVDGLNLAHLVRSEGPLAPSVVIEIGKQLAGALQAVHAADLVHRGIKPSNVMMFLLPNGDYFAKLLDFGVTKPMIGSQRSSGFVGSPAFAAPEQIREEEVDARTDIYQLGCVLFYALTGEPPFRGASPIDTMNAHLFQAVPRPSGLISRIRRWGLDDVVMQMLAKDPNERPQTASQVLAMLTNDANHGKPGSTDVGNNPRRTGAAVTVIGPDQSIVTARGNRIAVRTQSRSVFLDVGERQVSAVHAEVGRVLFGTAHGKVGFVDVSSGSCHERFQTARGVPIASVCTMRDTVLAVDDAGQIYRSASEGEYDVLRLGVTASSVAASQQSDTLALQVGPRQVRLYSGQVNLVEQGRVHTDFDVVQSALAPDGYVLALIGNSAMWIVSALDGSVLHRIKSKIGYANVTFSGPTLIGLERGTQRTHAVYEAY